MPLEVSPRHPLFLCVIEIEYPGGGLAQGQLPERPAQSGIATRLPPGGKAFFPARRVDHSLHFVPIIPPLLAKLTLMDSEGAQQGIDRMEIGIPGELRPKKIIPGEPE